MPEIAFFSSCQGLFACDRDHLVDFRIGSVILKFERDLNNAVG